MIHQVEFLACNGYFGLFTKIKKESGTSFGAHFEHDFFKKMLLI